jgi:DNA-binding LacI/PurR family transcriptional regulator
MDSMNRRPFKEAKLVTARDVAEAIGVSISTIGRAMADDPRISEATKVKVRKAAERAGYVGNMPARVMRGGTSSLVGLILPDVRNDFYSEIAQALSETCDREGYRLVLSITNDDRDLEARHIRELAGARVSGVIIVPSPQPRREGIKMLQGMPHVQLLRHVSSLGDIWFGIDDEAGLREATQHLLKLGHRRIAYIGGPEALSTGAARVRGFRSAFELAGISRAQATELLGPTTVAHGFSAAAEIARSSKAPTAILTGSVHITLGVIQMVEDLNISIPQQLSLIGFGDPIWFQWWRDGLTTIQLPIRELATTCGLWFLDNLRRKSETTAHQHKALTRSTLIERATTASRSTRHST